MTYRPHKIRWVAGGCAAGVVVLFTAISFGLHGSAGFDNSGHYERGDLLETATALTPGIESPTVSPLRREGWVAVQAMVRRAEVHRTMDDLYELGARAILVTDIANCRL